MVDSKASKPRGSAIITKVEGDGGATHSFTDEEKYGFVGLLNHYLKNDADLTGVIPLNDQDDSLFKSCYDGILLCKIINCAVPGTIDPRAINVRKGGKDINVFQAKENLRLAIASATSIGCIIINITPPLIMDARKHIILGVLWQILRIQMLSMINLKNHPYLVRLKKEDEELSDLLALPPEDLLLRWFNYHLKNAGHKRRVENFSGDLKDAENYTVLLNQLDSSKCDLDALTKDDATRAGKVIVDSKKLGVPPFMRVIDITSGNPKLNLIFCAQLFNNCPGLVPTEEEKYEAAQLMNDDVGDSREERAFRMWINSLGIEGVYVNHLFEDIKDGIVLLKVIDRVQPNLVVWKKAELKPTIKLKKIHNANYAVDLGKLMKFSLVGIGGVDLVDGNKKLSLAYIWQLVRKHTLDLLGDWTEEKLFSWAVERVKKEPKIASFKDPSIKNGQFLFNLLATIEPRAINWDLVTEGSTPEEIENNSKYILSIARKLGATIFLVWEDIRDVKPKMIMTLVGALAIIVSHGQKEEMVDISNPETTQI